LLIDELKFQEELKTGDITITIFIMCGSGYFSSSFWPSCSTFWTAN